MPVTHELNDTTNTEPQTGDANPNHGYESDGDVEMVSEQDTVKEIKSQANFEKSNPEAEALDHRYRDAESHLNERMSNNHSRHIAPPDEVDESASDKHLQTLDDQTHLPREREEDDKV